MYGKFIKGILVGGAIGAGVATGVSAMLNGPDAERSRKRMVRKGRQYMKKMGIWG